MTMQRTIFATILAGLAVMIAAPASAQLAEQVSPPRLTWSFAGPFGKYDEAQLQRGFKIYREVCSNCHSLNMLSFGNLADVGGPGFSEAQAVQIASEYKIKDLDDKGRADEPVGAGNQNFLHDLEVVKPPSFYYGIPAKLLESAT